MLCERIVEILEQTDPALGTVADRAAPGKSALSRYYAESVDNHLSFDVGNNLVSASISARGVIHRAMIFTGLSEEVTDLTLYPGVWSDYHYLDFGQDTSFALQIGDHRINLSQRGLSQDTSLVRGLFPLTSTDIHGLRLRQIAMAPIVRSRRMRALFVGILAESRTELGNVRIEIPSPRKGFEVRECLDSDGMGWVRRSMGRAEFILLDGLVKDPESNSYTFAAKADTLTWIPLLLVMGENANEFLLNRHEMQNIGSLDLMCETMSFFDDLIGRIVIPDADDPIPSIYSRSTHAQIISPLRDRSQNPLGSSFGTDVSEPITEGRLGHVWDMCAFYNYLSAGIACPEMLTDGIRFFMRRSTPVNILEMKRIATIYETRDLVHRLYSLGDRFERFPAHVIEKAIVDRARGEIRLRDYPNVRYSLSSEVQAIVLAGVFYSLTGDSEALVKLREVDVGTGRRKTLKSTITQTLDGLLSTKHNTEPLLFESIWLSDGLSRGKYHTGSNILTWYAFHSGARILREVFRDADTADRYDGVAARMKNDILKYCTIEHDGKMITEGHQAELLHDGEESMTTISPFLGFWAADSPELLRFKRFACSPQNPLWDPVTQGIVFGQRRITSPGFMSELAAAETEKELSETLRKLSSLADVDGQWWWWPMDKGDTAVVRGSAGKCGQAQGVFNILFLNTILGIQWDAPEKRLTIRPFVPWRHFKCEAIRFGSLTINLDFASDRRGASVDVKHNQGHLSDLNIAFRAPVEATRCEIAKASCQCLLSKGKPYYGKPTWVASIRDCTQPGVSVALRWE